MNKPCITTASLDLCMVTIHSFAFPPKILMAFKSGYNAMFCLSSVLTTARAFLL